MTKINDYVKEIFKKADIKVSDSKVGDIIVKNNRFYKRVLTSGSLGLGESYMDGDWETNSLEKLFYKITKNNLQEKAKNSKGIFFQFLKSLILNPQSKTRSRKVGKEHYDLGNRLYKLMLGKRMVYTCAYWKNSKTLDQAQERKLDLVCKKVGLKPGMKILDIGCGWGSFAKFAAEKYKVKVVGITISEEQAKLAKENCKGLDVEIRVQDYRDLKEKFDAIISLGMFEHVGSKNYDTYFKMANNCLKNKGIFLLHTIGRNKSSRYEANPWIRKYIFPGGQLPSLGQMAKASESYFVIEDVQNFGPDYAKTLEAWNANFEKNWNILKEEYQGKFNGKFKKLWNYYLLSCAGAFRSRSIQLYQLVLTKGLEERYDSPR